MDSPHITVYDSNASEDFSYYYLEDSSLRVTKLNEVLLKGGSSSKKNRKLLSGIFFVFPSRENFYFHVLRDTIAQYEIVKTVFPDILLLTFCYCNQENQRQGSLPSCISCNPTSRPHEFISKHYGDHLITVAIDDEDEILVESLAFIYINNSPELYPLKERYDYSKILTDSKSKNFLEYCFSNVLKNKYSENIKPISSGQKIYISRFKEARSDWELINLYDNYVKHGAVPVDLDVAQKIKKIASEGGKRLQELEIKRSRNFTLNDEAELESYFRSRGYLIISPGDYSVEEQIGIFSSSEVVVGAGGSGMTNVLFCSEVATIVLLSAGNFFGFGGHSRLIRAVTDKNYSIPKAVELCDNYLTSIKYDADYICGELDKLEMLQC